MRMDTDSTGKEFLEDGRVPADEIDGAGGDAEGLSLLGDEREWEGLGRLGLEEVLEVEQGLEVSFFLHGVVDGSVSDPFDGCDVEQGAVDLVVAAAAAGERTEKRLHSGGRGVLVVWTDERWKRRRGNRGKGFTRVLWNSIVVGKKRNERNFFLIFSLFWTKRAGEQIKNFPPIFFSFQNIVHDTRPDGVTQIMHT